MYSWVNIHIIIHEPADILPLLQIKHFNRHFDPLIRISQPTQFTFNCVGYSSLKSLFITKGLWVLGTTSEID